MKADTATGPNRVKSILDELDGSSVGVATSDMPSPFLKDEELYETGFDGDDIDDDEDDEDDDDDDDDDILAEKCEIAMDKESILTHGRIICKRDPEDPDKLIISGRIDNFLGDGDEEELGMTFNIGSHHPSMLPLM